MATEFDLRIALYNSTSIQDYFEKFLIPFFISDHIWRETGKHVFGDRDHGVTGIYQSISEYFKLRIIDRNFVNKLLEWAVKEKRFRDLFPDHKFRLKIQHNYSYKIGLIRRVGILNLKKVYYSLKNLDELEKKYFQYLKKNDREKESTRETA